jgi:hypothetical protein
MGGRLPTPKAAFFTSRRDRFPSVTFRRSRRKTVIGGMGLYWVDIKTNHPDCTENSALSVLFHVPTLLPRLVLEAEIRRVCGHRTLHLIRRSVGEICVDFYCHLHSGIRIAT